MPVEPLLAALLPARRLLPCLRALRACMRDVLPREFRHRVQNVLLPLRHPARRTRGAARGLPLPLLLLRAL
eukprot:3031782-Pyramimonas_sp.AAC.1